MKVSTKVVIVHVGESGVMLQDNSMDEFKRSLFALASSPEIQQELFPDFTCKGDELVLDFDDALSQVNTEEFNERQELAFKSLNEYLDEMSGEKFAEHYQDNELLYTSEIWKRIRLLFQDLIDSLGWVYEEPQNKRGTVYIGE